ncbi:MAG: hypothetical protein ACJ73S_14575 [Mycobacteriales bacterium]
MDETALWRRPIVIVATAALVVVVAAVAALAYAPDGGRPGRGPRLPSMTPTRELAIGTVRVGAYGSDLGDYVTLLDPRTRTYRRYQGSGQISPDGRRAVLWGSPGAGPNPRTASVVLLDLTTGQRRRLTLPRPAESYTWSRDGASILGTVVGDDAGATSNGTRLGFVLVRADTGAASYVQASPDSCASEDLGDFAWNADGTEVLAMTGGSQQPFRPCSITYFGLDGRPHRTLDGAGNVFGGGQRELSPDGGRLFALQRRNLDADAQGEQVVIDATTGARVGRIVAGDHAPYPVGWIDPDHVLAAQACGGRDNTRLVVVDLGGHVTRTVTACSRPAVPQLIPAAG